MICKAGSGGGGGLAKPLSSLSAGQDGHPTQLRDTGILSEHELPGTFFCQGPSPSSPDPALSHPLLLQGRTLSPAAGGPAGVL